MSHTSRSPSVDFFTGAHNFNVEHQYISVSPLSSPPLTVHEIQRLLSPIPGASHTRNMKRSPPDSTCLPGTRTMLLSSIMSWVKSDTGPEPCGSAVAEHGWRDDYGYYHYNPPSTKRVVWLCGPVGCGKSAIAQIVAKEAEDEGCLAASFFFFRGTGDRSSIARLAATLASQMAEAIPDTIPYIEDALKKWLSLQGASIDTQFECLIYHPVLAALGGRNKKPILILIDGLDECEDRREVEAFLDHMLSMFERHPDLPLRFFISSRIEEHIREHIEMNQVHVVNLRDHHSDKDISTLVQHTFEVAAFRNRVIRSYGKWPSEDEISALIRHARGSFIFVRTLLNFILGVESKRADRRTPMERFKLALDMNPGLDELYAEILQDALPTTHSTNVILTLAALKEPLSISDMARLLYIGACDVVNVLVPLQSIVHVPGDDDTRVTLFHTSLRDFIKNEDRSRSIFSETSRSEHRNFLAQRCLRLRLRIQEDGRSTFPYAMHYWVNHWQDAYSDVADVGALMDLVMSTAGSLPVPIPVRVAMVPFDAQIRTRRSNGQTASSLCDWLFDYIGHPLPGLDIVRHLVYPLYHNRRFTPCDPSLHRCTVMHLMRCVMSNRLQPSCFVYIAEHFSWNVLCMVDTDDDGGNHDIVAALQTPYRQERATSSELETGQAPFRSKYSRDPRDDEHLGMVLDFVNTKYPGIMDIYDQGTEQIPDHYTLYKEDGLCVLDMIHVLQRLDIAQSLAPGTKHVIIHIGDGDIICFSIRFKTRQAGFQGGFHLVRLNLYTDDIFQLFSEHLDTL